MRRRPADIVVENTGKHTGVVRHIILSLFLQQRMFNVHAEQIYKSYNILIMAFIVFTLGFYKLLYISSCTFDFNRTLVYFSKKNSKLRLCSFLILFANKFPQCLIFATRPRGKTHPIRCAVECYHCKD